MQAKLSEEPSFQITKPASFKGTTTEWVHFLWACIVAIVAVSGKVKQSIIMYRLLKTLKKCYFQLKMDPSVLLFIFTMYIVECAY